MEVTETAVMADPERTNSTLATLRALGARLAIDGFGAAYSSLARLRELPVDVLKIDAQFLRDVPGDAEATTTVGAVIDFERTLGLTAIAEGVETIEHREALVRLGCPLAQGYLLGRPAPPARWRAPGDPLPVSDASRQPTSR